MRTIKYELFPEAYGANNKFQTKEGTIGELIVDTGMLLSSDYDKVIPTMRILNGLLNKGACPRSGEWEPFEITEEEYVEVVTYLCSLKIPRPYRI